MLKKKSILILENKPTSSGLKKPAAVGGELIPLNPSKLIAGNMLLIILLILPIMIAYVLAKRGVHLPSPIRRLLRIIPIVGKVFLG
jgi:hypothetical protein